MTKQARGPRVHERWAHLRFSVVGQLLAAPPAKGELKAAIEGLAGRTWQHPTTGETRPLRLLYHRALVLPRVQGADRSGRRAPPQGPRQCRTAARDQ